jgi:hypothetical protein
MLGTENLDVRDDSIIIGFPIRKNDIKKNLGKMYCQNVATFNFLKANSFTDSDEPTFGSVIRKSFLIISVNQTQCPLYRITEKRGFVL